MPKGVRAARHMRAGPWLRLCKMMQDQAGILEQVWYACTQPHLELTCRHQLRGPSGCSRLLACILHYKKMPAGIAHIAQVLHRMIQD